MKFILLHLLNISVLLIIIILLLLLITGLDQSVSRLTTCWTIGDQGFESRQGLGVFLFDIVSRPAVRHTQPPTQWLFP
jgi:hypothetical protein